MRHVSAYAMKNVFSAINNLHTMPETKKKMHGERKKKKLSSNMIYISYKAGHSAVVCFSAEPGTTAAQEPGVGAGGPVITVDLPPPPNHRSLLMTACRKCP